MIIWVAGGRTYTDILSITGALRPYAVPGNLLVHGAAPGADLLSEDVWRGKFQLPSLGVPARWRDQGKRAGFERNSLLADGFRGLVPDLLLHFPGGRGTQMACDLADQRGIKRVAVLEETQ